MRGNRLAVEFQVFGENLWGLQTAWISRRSGLEIDHVYYICGGDGDLSSDSSNCLASGGVIELSISLNVWFDARSGFQKLFINQQEVRFFLEVLGEPEPTCERQD